MTDREQDCVCSREGIPDGGRESPRTYVGVVRPEWEVLSVVEDAEKEKLGSGSSSQDGRTMSEELCKPWFRVD